MMNAPRSLLRSGLFVGLLAAQIGCGGQTASRRLADEGPSPRRTVITAEDIQNYPTTMSIEQLLVQHVPGLQLLTRFDGTMTLTIMGLSSSRNGEPLYVVDGVPRSNPSGQIPVTPQDVEWIEVLKDGGALAAYGLRGANGVILIRTRRGALPPSTNSR